MAFSSKHLTQGEHVETQFRTHAKKIFGPILLIIAMIAVVIVAYAFLQDTAWPWLFIAIAVVALLIAITWAFIPIWKWRNTLFVLTNRRLITRNGIMAKSGRDIPLFRINDVQYEKGVADRILGCGTLIVSDASDQPPLRLHDIPHVEAVQVKLNELLFAHHDDADEGGAPRADRRRDDVEEPFDQQSYDDHDRQHGRRHGRREDRQDRAAEAQQFTRREQDGPYDQDQSYAQNQQQGYDRGYDQNRERSAAPGSGPYDQQQSQQQLPQHRQEYEQGFQEGYQQGQQPGHPQTDPQTRPMPRRDRDTDH